MLFSFSLNKLIIGKIQKGNHLPISTLQRIKYQNQILSHTWQEIWCSQTFSWFQTTILHSTRTGRCHKDRCKASSCPEFPPAGFTTLALRRVSSNRCHLFYLTEYNSSTTSKTSTPASTHLQELWAGQFRPGCPGPDQLTRPPSWTCPSTGTTSSTLQERQQTSWPYTTPPFRAYQCCPGPGIGPTSGTTPEPETENLAR